MTNAEIIKGLKAVRTIHNGNYAPFIDGAIKALSRSENPNKWIAEDVLDKIRAEIQATIGEERTGNGNINKGVVIGLQMALDTIDKYKAESEEK